MDTICDSSKDKYKNITESFDGAPFGVATMAGTLTLPGETNNTVVLDALGHHGTGSIAWGEHYNPFLHRSVFLVILFLTLGVAV